MGKKVKGQGDDTYKRYQWPPVESCCGSPAGPWGTAAYCGSCNVHVVTYMNCCDCHFAMGEEVVQTHLINEEVAGKKYDLICETCAEKLSAQAAAAPEQRDSCFYCGVDNGSVTSGSVFGALRVGIHCCQCGAG